MIPKISEKFAQSQVEISEARARVLLQDLFDVTASCQSEAKRLKNSMSEQLTVDEALQITTEMINISHRLFIAIQNLNSGCAQLRSNAAIFRELLQG